MRVSLLRLAGSIVKHSQDAEDAVSAAMVQAYQKVDELRDETKLRSWMLTITTRCCYDLMRKGKRERPIEDASVFDTSIFQPNGTLYEMLRELPSTSAQVLTLYYYEGLSTAEIASVLGLARPTVSMRMVRGRKQLKNILEGATDE